MADKEQSRDAGILDETGDAEKNDLHRGADIPVGDHSPQTENGECEDTRCASSRKKEDSKVLQALHEMAADEDAPIDTHSRVSLSTILGGDILGGRWFRKQIGYMLMVTAMIVVYVSNRYACQQEMIEAKVLGDTLLDRRYKALTRSSQLKERTRRSFIEQSLADSTLQTAKTPSFKLKVDE